MRIIPREELKFYRALKKACMPLRAVLIVDATRLKPKPPTSSEYWSAILPDAVSAPVAALSGVLAARGTLTEQGM
jgi:hypothetical protein